MNTAIQLYRPVVMMRVAPAPRRIVRLLPALDYGGVETRAETLANLHDRSRFELHVVALHHDGSVAERLRRAGIAVHVLDVQPSIRRVDTTLALARLLSSLRPEVVHAAIIEAVWHGRWASLLARVPHFIAEEVGVPQRRALGQRVMRAVWQRSDRVVAVSHVVARALVENEGAPANRMRVVHNAVSSKFLAPVVPRAKQGRLVIATVGRLVPIKDHQTIIKGLARALRAGADVGLIVVGDGAERQALEGLVQTLGIADRVNFVGFRSDVIEILDRSDAFVLASRHEGFGIALAEALARNRPVIASSAPGLVEVLAGAEVGRAFAVGDEEALSRALIELASLSASEITSLGERGRKLVEERYTPEAHVNAVQALWDEVLAE